MTQPTIPTHDPFCSLWAQEIDEPRYGTAVHVGTWLLLEYAGPWRARATEDNDLPQAVQLWLDEQLARLDNGRLQFIKHAESGNRPGVSFFVGRNDDVAPAFYEFHVESYDDLIKLDIPAISRGEGAYEPFRRHEPLFTVCTNGLRDRCCAKFGLEIYNLLLEPLGDAIWQTTHLGGHRFAPNVLTFPDATSYGHLTSDEALTLVEIQAQGQLMLEKLRGRTCYEPFVQAADFFLRRETGPRELDCFHYLGAEETGPNHWLVRFRERPSGQQHQIELIQEQALRHIFASCGAASPKSVPSYHFLNHTLN